MTKIKVEHSTDYTVLSNSIFRDKNLSLKARGLLTTMLSMPEDWDFTVDGLSVILKEGKSTIKSTLQELEETHYLVRHQKRNEKGYFSNTEYILYETPMVDKQIAENPIAENQSAENRTQLNKYILSKKELSKKESNTLYAHNEKKADGEEKHSYRFVPPTVEEVQAYCTERKNSIDAEVFCDYYASKGWMIGRNKMKDWKAAIRTWERNESRKPKTDSTGVELDDEIDHSLDGIF